MSESTVTVPQKAPPAWLNSMMGVMLKTPGLQRWLGRGLALLTFTGRRTGKRYTIPVSYARTGDEVLVVTKKTRAWWRNFADRPVVELRLAGRIHRGRATASIGDTSRMELLRTYLSERPVDAKAFGVRNEDGLANADDVIALLPQVVLVDIELV